MSYRDTAPADPPVPVSPDAGHDQTGSPNSGLTGQMLPGGLRVLGRLGSTPEGTLYQAEYLNGVEVGVLILPLEPGGAQSTRRKRLEEATQIQHFNVARMYDVGQMGDGSLYVVLEQLVGEPLSDLLATGRVFALPDALDLALQAAAGLKAAHRAGFVHGNLSPDTIVVPTGTHGRPEVKLIRFSLDPAQRQAGSMPTMPGNATADYASPERLAGQSPDERSDVFSLGAVLHHLLTGIPPSRGKVDSSVPDIARAVLGTALTPAPSGRFQTISEFEAALERLAALAGKRTRRSVRRSLVIGAVGVGLALVTAGIVLRSNVRWPTPSEERPRPSPVREAPAATPLARSPQAPSAAPQDAPLTRNRPTERVPSSAPAGAKRPVSTPSTVADPDTDRAIEPEPASISAPKEPPPPTMEQRAQVFLRIGLDEALRQLGRPVHAIEGMTPLFLGLARSRFPPFTDTTRPVVRSVYIGPNEDLILLDQQRIRPGGRMGAATATSWRMGDVMLYLHGDARPEVLSTLVGRVR